MYVLKNRLKMAKKETSITLLAIAVYEIQPGGRMDRRTHGLKIQNL